MSWRKEPVSTVQEFEGKDIPFEEVGFAFNYYFLNDILRERTIRF